MPFIPAAEPRVFRIIRTVYDGLLAGSEKHLRSYANASAERKIKYDPMHLSQEEYDGIIRRP